MRGSRQLEIEAVDPFRDASWDEQVAGSEHHHIFHLGAWARVLVETYRQRPHFLRIRQGSETAALLPVMEVRSALTGRRGVSMPFGDLAGLLILRGPLTRDLAPLLSDWIRGNRWSHLELRGSWEPRENQCIPAVRSYLEHELDLVQNSSVMFANLSASNRRALRKSERGGLVLSMEATREAILEYYHLHERTRRRHGLPPQPRRYFEAISRNLVERGHGWVVTARKGRRAIASALFLGSGTKAIYKFGASDPGFWPLRPNQAVMWHAILRLVDRGFKTLHFGRTHPDDEGLKRFKSSWGCRTRTLSYLRLRADGSWASPGSLPAESHAWLFGRMPLAANRIAGRLIYPHLD